jgi:hypothetical protein
MLNGVYDVAHGLTSAIARRPFCGFDFFCHKCLEWAPLPLTFAGSFQGAYTEARCWDRFTFWLTVFAGDLIETSYPKSITGAVRNGVLTVLTLLNSQGSQQSSMNKEEVDGVVDPIAFLCTKLLALTVAREDYTHPLEVPGSVWAKWLAGGAGMGALAGSAGAGVAELLAWTPDWKLIGWTMLKAMPKVLLMFWPVLYSTREGDTDDGRFNAGAGGDFMGYPDKPSPYLLPFAPGRLVQVPQGNQGMWSHNAQNGNVLSYAYDFSLDRDEEVLASRPGTVVHFYQDTQDDQTGRANSIRIRHDLDDNGNPAVPDPTHDQDAAGQVTRTFAYYCHGRQGSVTRVFTARPNSPGWPIPLGGKPPGAVTLALTGGQVVWVDAAGNQINDPATGNPVPVTVARGQPIMLAGDTGTSFFNHLHMHVLPGSAGPTSTNANDDYTVPFVFQDVDGDGVCQTFSWYESQNTRIP